jgi:predicted metallo-beta-lactamase superfamily hydrolase
MRIEIVGTESLGVRGLCCLVETQGRRIVIDPGVALGYHRAGLLPHPVQVAAGEDVRERVIGSLRSATDIVISHFHGDHMPLADANPYQLSLKAVADVLRDKRLWLKGLDGESPHVAERRNRLCADLQEDPPACHGQSHVALSFSETMPHGLATHPMGTVMMTRVDDGADVFVHASDIQLLADEPIRQILDWAPDVVLVSGPPLYRNLPAGELRKARGRLRLLGESIPVCIVDHHLLRSVRGLRWLDALSAETNRRITCAADFMRQPRRLLEARRSDLYERFPVPDGWHEAYASGKETTSAFRRLDASA